MGRKVTRNGDHWRAVDSLLQRWLGDRQQLLSLLCELGAVVRSGPHRSAARQKLDRFCEVLVDYVSAGHFEIYCALLDEGERFGAKRCREAADLYRGPLLAQIPTVTAVSRQALVSGRRPAEFAKTISSNAGEPISIKYIDPSYMIRSGAANAYAGPVAPPVPEK